MKTQNLQQKKQRVINDESNGNYSPDNEIKF